ncbi:hypothetical protein C8J56DRAFT_1005111 [Mycena floridula]|nr:hypothetical protein C8J56DRAFT_1005111 [Mycena floridula]
MHLCTCSSLPGQLLSRGFFPCAPKLPTLAVDVNMLDFVSGLFLNIAPNHTAWTSAVEDFLVKRQYKLDSLDGSLRRRFTLSLQWYTTLVDMVALEDVNDRASDYLREKCPLCFGALGRQSQGGKLVDVIVCLDANFTQKRCAEQANHGVNHLPWNLPETVFIPKEDVEAMKEKVENIRPPKPVRHSQVQRDPEDDGYDRKLCIPRSVLRTKASTTFFADTGLMALLCRHDKVLCQYFAFTLLSTLFEHLPPFVRAGVLYDKWGFLSEFRDRIVFGLSWACQLVYHPRKCPGFGLSDGEGCERIWKALKHLISTLRISGYHARIYTLDSQIKQFDIKAIKSMGAWLSRKYLAMEKCKAENLHELAATSVSEEVLHAQWAAQVADQTRPQPRRSKKSARQAIERILELRKREELEKEELERLRNSMQTDDDDEMFIVDEIENCRKSIHELQHQISKCRAVLTSDDKVDLQKLMSDKFIQMKINALSLKTHIRNRLRHRKFELEATVQNYRGTVNRNHQKLEAHADKEAKRRVSGLNSLVKSYNDLCEEMDRWIQRRPMNSNIVAPMRIEKEGLFDLDVDSPIWDDIGLRDESEGVEPLPGWLADDDIRKGIRCMLELDRCEEEEIRLKEEANALKVWMVEEWGCLIARWQPQLRVLGLDSDSDWGPTLADIYAAREAQTAPMADSEDQYSESDMEYGPGSDKDVEEVEDEDLEFISEVLDSLTIAGALQ